MLPLLSDLNKFKFKILWEGERRLNIENEQVEVTEDGQIVESFTRFGEKTSIDDSQLPSIDELYRMIEKIR